MIVRHDAANSPTGCRCARFEYRCAVLVVAVDEVLLESRSMWVSTEFRELLEYLLVTGMDGRSWSPALEQSPARNLEALQVTEMDPRGRLRTLRP